MERRRLWRLVWLAAVLVALLAGIVLAMFRREGPDDNRDEGRARPAFSLVGAAGGDGHGPAGIGA